MVQQQSLLKSSFAGALGGALGTLVLNLFQKASLEGTRRAEDVLADDHTFTKQQKQLLETFVDAHIATAASLGARVPRRDRETTAMGVEFAFGIICGALYGACAKYQPAVTVGFGGIYGAVLFTGASEIVLQPSALFPHLQLELQSNMRAD